MEYKRIRVLCVLVSILARDMIGVQACTHWSSHIRSPDHDEPDGLKVYYSDYVVFGRTVNVDYRSPIQGVYTASFDVQCVYKTNGTVAQVPEFIRVKGVGNEENQLPGCPPSPLKPGQTAILFLTKPRDQPDGVFEIQFKPFSEEDIPDEMKLDDLTLHCGLKLTFLRGRKLDICYEPLEEGDCIKYIPDTPEPTMETATTIPTTIPETTEGTTSAPTQATSTQGLPTPQAIPSWAMELIDELKQLKSQMNAMDETVASFDDRVGKIGDVDRTTIFGILTRILNLVNVNTRQILNHCTALGSPTLKN